jgi:hypothetical protein
VTMTDPLARPNARGLLLIRRRPLAVATRLIASERGASLRNLVPKGTLPLRTDRSPDSVRRRGRAAPWRAVHVRGYTLVTAVWLTDIVNIH